MLVSDILKQLDHFVSLGTNRACFRGQACTWPLRPKAYRPEFAGPGNAFLYLAESRFQQWEVEAQPYFRKDIEMPVSKWERLAAAQHFGLATRLLDWTSNPLVSIFFAAHGHEENDGEIIIWQFDMSLYNNASSPPEKAENLVLFRPAPAFPRLKFQQGLLSYHPNPATEVPDTQLHRISVPAAQKYQLQYELGRIGVDHESVFGTLDHLATKINWLSQNCARDGIQPSHFKR